MHERMDGRTDEWTHSFTHACIERGESAEMEDEEKGDIERLVFCQLIYSYELARGEVFSFGGIQEQNKRRCARAHS